MIIMKDQKSKQFKDLYPDYDAFNNHVWKEVNRLGLLFNAKKGLPEYLDDTKTFYNSELLFHFFSNKYENFWSVVSEDRVHKLFVNALLQTLPALFLKTRLLTPEALALFDPAKLLENIERRYNENPDTNYASTETAYSSTPSSSQASGTWNLDNTKEKNITLRKDATIRVRELSNIIKKLDEVNSTDVSGYIYEFINSIEFSSMWNFEENILHKVVEGLALDFTGAADGQVLSYDASSNSYKWVNAGGSSTPIGGGVPWLTDKYTNLAEFENAKNNDYEIVKYNANKDGTNNAEGILLLVKVGSEVKEFRTWEEIKQYVDNHLLLKADKSNVDQNTADIAQLASEIQVIENTWTGDLLMPSSGTSDLSALQGDKGAFDFTAGKKLIVTIGAMGKAITDTKILKVGTSGSYHLVGEGVDTTFGVTVADTGVLTIQNFASTGTTSIDMHGLIIKEIEQNPKAVAVIDAYTKAEADARFEPKAPVKYTPTFTHQAGFMVASAPAGIDALPDNTVMAFDLSGISAIATNPAIPADGDQLFIGSIPVRIPNTAGSAALKWVTKTNPTDSNVQENYQTKLLEVKLKTFNGNKELDLVSWKDKDNVPTNIDTYTKAEIDAKLEMDDASMIDLENIGITTK